MSERFGAPNGPWLPHPRAVAADFGRNSAAGRRRWRTAGRGATPADQARDGRSDRLNPTLATTRVPIMDIADLVEREIKRIGSDVVGLRRGFENDIASTRRLVDDLKTYSDYHGREFEEKIADLSKGLNAVTAAL